MIHFVASIKIFHCLLEQVIFVGQQLFSFYCLMENKWEIPKIIKKLKKKPFYALWIDLLIAKLPTYFYTLETFVICWYEKWNSLTEDCL